MCSCIASHIVSIQRCREQVPNQAYTNCHYFYELSFLILFHFIFTLNCVCYVMSTYVAPSVVWCSDSTGSLDAAGSISISVIVFLLFCADTCANCKSDVDESRVKEKTEHPISCKNTMMMMKRDKKEEEDGKFIVSNHCWKSFSRANVLDLSQLSFGDTDHEWRDLHLQNLQCSESNMLTAVCRYPKRHTSALLLKVC